MLMCPLAEEAILQNLLAQKKEIKKKLAAWEGALDKKDKKVRCMQRLAACPEFEGGLWEAWYAACHNMG